MLKTQNNSDETLQRLKELLLASELETLKQVKEQVDSLLVECRSADEIIERIEPLITPILRRHFKRHHDDIVTLLSEYISHVLTEASARRLPDLSRALRPVIAPAISKEIADNKDTMIDALYPIIGGMIAKYVTRSIKELTERINRKLEEGFSFQALKRKIKAKLTGVSESELLLEEGNDARILALFIIHKETGLLIASAQVEENFVQDTHMVAAMASAVKDFLNDSFDFRSKVQEEVQIVSYGDATLYIESAGSVYMIAFLDGEPDYEQRRKTNAFFASLVRRYAHFFQDFDGDESATEIQELTTKLHRYLSDIAQTTHTETKSFDKVWIGGILVLAIVGYIGYTGYHTYRIKQIQKQIQQLGMRNVSIEEINETAYKLRGIVDDAQALHLAKRLISQVFKNSTVIDETVASAALTVSMQHRVVRLKNEVKRYEDLAKKIQILRSDYNRTQHMFEVLRASYDKLASDYDGLRQSYRLLHQRIYLPQNLKKALDQTLQNNPYYDASTGKLNFASLHPFEPMQATVRPEALIPLRQTIRDYIFALCSFSHAIETITIAAFSDTDGDANKNVILTQKRAQEIVAMIRQDHTLHQCFKPARFQAVGYGESRPVFVDGKEDKNASRRIEVFYKLKAHF